MSKESLRGHHKALALPLLCLCLVPPMFSETRTWIGNEWAAGRSGPGCLRRLGDEDQRHQAQGCTTASGEQLPSNSCPATCALHTYEKMELSTHRAAWLSLQQLSLALCSISVLYHEQWAYAAAFLAGLSKASFPLIARQPPSSRRRQNSNPQSQKVRQKEFQVF